MSEPELPTTVVPWWQDGETISAELKEPYFLSRGVHQFFKLIKGWMLYPLNQSDPLTCSESLLNLMAWDRDITRFSGEPLTLYRKRVKYAAINAKDAGTVAGFKAIFARLGIGIAAFKERQNEEWDIVTIEMTDNDLSANSALVQTLVEQYGLTCRRYRVEVSYPSTLSIAGGIFPHNIATFSALQVVRIYPKNSAVLGRSILGRSTLGL